MAKQAVSLLVSNAPGIGGTPEWTDFDISDLGIDDLETTYQGTSSGGAQAYRTYVPSALRTTGTIRLSMLYNGELVTLGAETTAGSPMTLKLDRATDIVIFSGLVYLKSFKITGTLGENLTAEAEFKMKGSGTAGDALTIGAA